MGLLITMGMIFILIVVGYYTFMVWKDFFETFKYNHKDHGK